MADSGRWSVRGLVLSWVAYWAGLALVTLGPAFAAIWRATHLPEGRGAISLGFSNASLNLSMTDSGSPIWAGSVHIAVLALWLSLPPLAIWAVWIAANARSVPRTPTARPELADGGAQSNMRSAQSAEAEPSEESARH